MNRAVSHIKRIIFKKGICFKVEPTNKLTELNTFREENINNDEIRSVFH